jgi:hypothetical protein
VFCNKFLCFIKEGHKLGKIEPLFKRITEADVKAWKEKFGGVQNPTGTPGAATAGPAGATDQNAKGKGDKKQVKEKKPPREKKPPVVDASTDAVVATPVATSVTDVNPEVKKD